jgi:hypothetical protein
MFILNVVDETGEIIEIIAVKWFNLFVLPQIQCADTTYECVYLQDTEELLLV